MSNDQNVVSDNNQSIDGVDDGSKKSNEAETVSVDYAKRLLRQHKNSQSENQQLKDQLSQFQQAEEARSKADLEAKEEFKKLYTMEQEKVKKLADSVNHYETTMVEGVKLQAFINKVPGKVKQDYYVHVPLDKIAMNPDTKEVDMDSVDLAVSEFMEKHYDLVKPTDSKKLPNSASRNEGLALTYAEEVARCRTQEEFDALRKKHDRYTGAPGI